LKTFNKITLVAIIGFCLVSCSEKKLGYVDINKLYESFEYKKKLTKEYETVKSARQRITDSLEMLLNQTASEIERTKNFSLETEKKFEQQKKDFYQLSRQYDEDNAVLLTSYDDKIISQLNAYIKEYGKSNAYDLLVGADKKGSILYGDEKIDVTDELVEYVNKRYSGAKEGI
jgi:outer membrane protein